MQRCKRPCIVVELGRPTPPARISGRPRGPPETAFKTHQRFLPGEKRGSPRGFSRLTERFGRTFLKHSIQLPKERRKSTVQHDPPKTWASCGRFVGHIFRDEKRHISFSSRMPLAGHRLNNDDGSRSTAAQTTL
jgi:hypothetical protein